MSIPRQTEIMEFPIYLTRSVTTGSVALSKSEATPSTGKQWKLKEVRISLDAVGEAGNLTITINDATGAVYDHVLLTQDMSAVQYLRYVPSGELILKSGDTIDIAWANANSHTYGMVVEKQLYF